MANSHRRNSSSRPSKVWGQARALVFQISPLPPQLRRRMSEQLQRLDALLAALPALPHGVVAIEVRDQSG